LRAGQDAVNDPAHKELLTRLQEAMRQGDDEETKHVSRELKDLRDRHRKEDIDRLKTTTDGTVDQVIIANYLALPPLIDTDEEDDATARAVKYDGPEYQALARRMGQLPMLDGHSAPGSRCYSAAYGSVTSSGVRLNFSYLSFEDPIEGARALVAWLASRGCRSMRYEFHISPSEGLGD
jgi:hypothetical protein